MATTDGSVARWQDLGRALEFQSTFKGKTKPLAPSKPQKLVSAKPKSKPNCPQPITYESVMGKGFPKTHSVIKKSHSIEALKEDLRPSVVKTKPLIPQKPKTLKPDSINTPPLKPDSVNTKKAPPLKPKPKLPEKGAPPIGEVKPPKKPSFLRISKSSGNLPTAKSKPVIPPKKIVSPGSLALKRVPHPPNGKVHKEGIHHQLTSILSQGSAGLQRRSTLPESKAEAKSKPSVGLNHLTKTRSKGPKRRLPTSLKQ